MKKNYLLAAMLWLCVSNASAQVSQVASFGHQHGSGCEKVCQLRVDPTPKRVYTPPPPEFYQQIKNPNRVQTATVTVNYTGFTAQAQAAFQFAVDIWQTQITTPINITVNANFVSLGAGILGSAGPNGLLRDFTGAPQANTFYARALADKLSNSNIGGTNLEITANFNSDFTNWYFGTDGATPFTEFDFVSVVLHELGHGFGFLGFGDVSGGNGSVRLGAPANPSIYDRFVENGSGTPITSFTDPSAALAAQLQGGDLFFDGTFARQANGGNPAEIYAPATFNGGSSYSHLDEGFNGSINALMTFSISNGEAIHNPGPVMLGMFRDMGWTTQPYAQATALNFSSVTSNSMDLSFTAASPVADGYVVLRRAGGAPTGVPVDGTVYTAGVSTIGGDPVVFNGSATSFSQTGLSGSTAYSYAVYAFNDNGTLRDYRTVTPLTGSQTTLSAVVPDPTSLTINSVGTTSVDLSWTGSSAEFRLLRKVGSSSTNSADGTVAFEGVGTSTTVAGLTPNTPYFFTLFGKAAGAATFSSGNVKVATGSVSTTPATNATVTYLNGESGSKSAGTTGLTLNFTSASTADGFLTVTRTNAAPTGNNSISGTVNANGNTVTPNILSTDRFWTATNTGLTAFQYSVSLDAGGITGAPQPNRLTVIKRDAGGWVAQNTTLSGNTISATGLTSFSDFGIGANSVDNPLPVELSGFTAQATASGVQLNWTTASEKDNAGFTVLRTLQGETGAQVIATHEFDNALRGRGTTSSASAYQYIDATIEVGKTYTYALRSVDYSGAAHFYTNAATVEVRESVFKGVDYKLEQNYPNPFNPATVIGFTMKRAGEATIRIYNTLGMLVSEKKMTVSAGRQEYRFDASSLASGTYFYQLNTVGFSQTRKMQIVK